MTGFELFEYCQKRHAEIEPGKLHPKELAAIIRKTEKTILAHCGELKRFSAPEVVEEIIEFLRRGGRFETSCGKYIYAEENGSNLLIEALQKKGLLNPENVNLKIMYSAVPPLLNVRAGMTHMIIFDGGEAIFVEQPHGCSDEPDEENRLGLLIKDDRKLGVALEGYMWPDPEARQVSSGNEDFFVKVCLQMKREEWLEDKQFNAFTDVKEFEECDKRYTAKVYAEAL